MTMNFREMKNKQDAPNKITIMEKNMKKEVLDLIAEGYVDSFNFLLTLLIFVTSPFWVPMWLIHRKMEKMNLYRMFKVIEYKNNLVTLQVPDAKKWKGHFVYKPWKRIGKFSILKLKCYQDQ